MQGLSANTVDQSCRFRREDMHMFVCTWHRSPSIPRKPALRQGVMGFLVAAEVVLIIAAMLISPVPAVQRPNLIFAMADQ